MNSLSLKTGGVWSVHAAENAHGTGDSNEIRTHAILVDSGASHDMSPFLEDFESLDRTKTLALKVADRVSPQP